MSVDDHERLWVAQDAEWWHVRGVTTGAVEQWYKRR
jgi:hypothetical protein